MNHSGEIISRVGVIRIVDNGRGWIVVDKPAGLSIHNDPGQDLYSLLSDYIQRLSFIFEDKYEESGPELSPVNRIDKDTSGLILFALNKKTASFLGSQFQNRTVRKKYIALLHGSLPESGVWDMPLTKNAGGRNNPAGSGKKADCRTKFKVISASSHYSLVECELVTGRKHQIRRHAKLNKTPITGDRIYGSPRSLRFLRENCGFERLGLHAGSLEFRTPAGEVRHIESKTPEIILRLIADKAEQPVL